MALPSPATVFLHSIFDGVWCENSNVLPTLTMLVGEEEDVFDLAFKEANLFSGFDVKPDVPRSQSMLFTNRTSEPLLDNASAQLSSPAAETCQSKAAILREPSIHLDSPSHTKSLFSPSEFNTSPNKRTKAPKRRRRKKPHLSTAESKAIRAKFLQRNRIAARTCRRKRKDWIISLDLANLICKG